MGFVIDKTAFIFRKVFWYFYYGFFGNRPFKNTGVEVRLYTEKFNHSKIFYVDGVVTSIGSANHDIYSLENDTESTLISYDRNFNAAVHEKLMYDLKTTDRKSTRLNSSH